MKRLVGYLLVVVGLPIVAALVFTATEEVDPASSEPGEYDLFLAIAVGEALVLAIVLCVVAELVFRVVRFLRRRRRTDTAR